MTDDPTRTMRRTFRVWNVDRVEDEVVLRSSDEEYVAVPLSEENAGLFERLVDSSGTVDATLVPTEDGTTSWQVDAIHGVQEEN